ncbi:MAG: class I SAM-dependent methyltransferase [Caldilineaceae bacterium]
MFSRNPLFRPSRWRSNLVRALTGDILEIGVGTGENLPYYRAARHIWGIEPDAERAAEARQVAATLTIPVTIDVTGAETLPYPDQQFDHVVSSLVFCSVNDQRQVLAEIQRVLKPGGALHMVEHIRPQNRVLAWLFSAITPWWRKVAFNCHLDRPTIDVLKEEGWQVQVHQRIAMFVRMSATPPRTV